MEKSDFTKILEVALLSFDNVDGYKMLGNELKHKHISVGKKLKEFVEREWWMKNFKNQYQLQKN